MRVRFIDTETRQEIRNVDLDRIPCRGETVNFGIVFFKVGDVATSIDMLTGNLIAYTVVLKKARI